MEQHQQVESTEVFEGAPEVRAPPPPRPPGGSGCCDTEGAETSVTVEVRGVAAGIWLERKHLEAELKEDHNKLTKDTFDDVIGWLFVLATK